MLLKGKKIMRKVKHAKALKAEIGGF